MHDATGSRSAEPCHHAYKQTGDDQEHMAGELRVQPTSQLSGKFVFERVLKMTLATRPPSLLDSTS